MYVKANNEPGNLATQLGQRVGIFSELPGLISYLGADPVRVLKSHGLSVESFRDPDSLLPYGTLVELLETCAREIGCADFGLQFGALGRVKHLGMVGLLISAAPTLTQAMRDFTGNHHRLARGGAVYLSEGSDTIKIGYRPLLGNGSSQQFAMASIAYGYRIFKELSGISPSRVLLGCSRPRSRNVAKYFPGSEVQFDATEFALEYPTVVADAPIVARSGNLRDAIADLIEHSAGYLEPDIVDLTKRKIVLLLFNRELSADRVAAAMNMQRRRLNRHLKPYGMSIHRLIEDVRFELACQFMASTRLPLGEIADCLGFEEAGSFSRFFRRRQDIPPSAWRTAQERGLPAAR